MVNRKLLAWVWSFALSATQGMSGAATLLPSRDTSLFELENSSSSGVGKLFVGLTGSQADDARRRAIMAFDVSSSIPGGAVISAARLSFQVTRVRVSASKAIDLHRATAAWGEGNSNATRGQGADATAGDATWDQRVFGADPAEPWAIPGGEFVAESSGSTTVQLEGRYQVSGRGLVADVQAWVNGAPNHGWFLIGDERTPGTAFHVASREDGNTAFRPRLHIEYSDPGSLPAGYYDSATGKTGAALRSALHDLIDNHNVIPYSAPSSTTDSSDALRAIDQDPANSNNLILIYSRRSESKSNFATGPGWNREHLWPQSLGVGEEPARSDLHALRPCDEQVNSERGNKHFDRSSAHEGGIVSPAHAEAPLTRADGNSWEPPDAYKGDIARSLFYLDVRYEGDAPFEPDLVLTDQLHTITTGGTLMGRLSTLLRWHFDDPVSAEERLRNNRVFQYQNNRNPFVDRPDFVWHIFLNIVSARIENGQVVIRWPARYDFTRMSVGSRVDNIAPIASSPPMVENGMRVFKVDPVLPMNFFLPGVD